MSLRDAFRVRLLYAQHQQRLFAPGIAPSPYDPAAAATPSLGGAAAAPVAAATSGSGGAEPAARRMPGVGEPVLHPYGLLLPNQLPASSYVPFSVWLPNKVSFTPTSIVHHPSPWQCVGDASDARKQEQVSVPATHGM